MRNGKTWLVKATMTLLAVCCTLGVWAADTIGSPKEKMGELVYAVVGTTGSGSSVRIVDAETGTETGSLSMGVEGLNSGSLWLRSERKYNVEWVSDPSRPGQDSLCSFCLLFKPSEEFYTMRKGEAPLESRRLTQFGDRTNLLTGAFSVSEDKKVGFAKGNLQYWYDSNGNDHWAFAEHQYDMLGESNLKEYTNGIYLSDRIDLLCWSTGRNYNGTWYANGYDDKYFRGLFAEWGENPALANELGAGWRTLTKDEWNYLLNERPKASELAAFATVHGVRGLVLLPDEYTVATAIANNVFTADQWELMEQAGAVFLPAAGKSPTGQNVEQAGESGFYWCSTPAGDNEAYTVSFTNSVSSSATVSRRTGAAVRLVKRLEIVKAQGSIRFATDSVSKTYGDADFTNELTLTGDGTVRYLSDNEDVAMVDSLTGCVTIVGAGETAITATVADGKNYEYETKSATYTLLVGTATMEVLATGYQGTYDGQAHTINVTAPKGGTLKFGVTADSCVLDTIPTYIYAGTYTVYYEVTLQNHTPVKGSKLVEITKAAGSIRFTTDSISKTYGDADFINELTLAGDGTVYYASDNEDVANVDCLTGRVTIVGAGEAVITATVTGGKNYEYGTNAATYTLLVETTTMEVLATGYQGTYDGLPHSISVTAPKGTTVMFGETADSCVLDTIPTYIDAGVYTVYYEVTLQNHTPVKGSKLVEITKAAGSIRFTTDSISKTYGDADFINELTLAGDGTVYYASDNEDVANVDSLTGRVTIVGAGETAITATVVDGRNHEYETNTATYTLLVGTATMEVKATGYQGTYDGLPHSLSVTAPKGAIVIYGETADSCVLDTIPTYIYAGTYTVYYEVTLPNYTSIKGSKLVEITKAAGSISFATDSISKTYGDANFTNELTLTGDGTVYYASDNEDVATIDSLTGCVTIVGAGEAMITAAITDGRNYEYDTKTVAYKLIVIDKAALGILSKQSDGYAANAWFDMNGRRLKGKPTVKGIYMNNGRKVVIK